jgi:hypothetical protein
MNENAHSYYIENKEIFAARAKKSYEKNKVKIAARNKKKYYDLRGGVVGKKGRKPTGIDPVTKMLQRAKDRSKKSGIEFSIEKSDIIIPEVCPYLGIEISQSKGGKTDNSPSLDRIDNSKGYVKGNVEVISSRANTIKNCGTSGEHLAIGERMKNLLD